MQDCGFKTIWTIAGGPLSWGNAALAYVTLIIAIIIIIPLGAVGKAELISYKDKIRSHRTSADTNTRFNRHMFNNSPTKMLMIKSYTLWIELRPLAHSVRALCLSTVALRIHRAASDGWSCLKKRKKEKRKDVWRGKSLPASPRNAFSTATPLSSSCLCFSSTCSNCLWMIWREKKRGAGQSRVINEEHRGLNAVSHRHTQRGSVWTTWLVVEGSVESNNGLQSH